MNRTKVDWYQGRCQISDPRAIVAAFRGGFGQFADRLDLRSRRHGLMGFVSSADIVIGEMPVGVVAFGGEGQKGWVTANITGQACAYVDDWDALQEGCATLPAWEPRRVDIALDTFHGEVTHETVRDALGRGAFTRGGRPPKAIEHVPTNPRDGRTWDIGDRKNSGQFARCYEKGWERCKKLRLDPDDTHLDGIELSKWFRCEVEHKVKDESFPSDIVDRRDQYFAGAYPYFGEVLAVKPEVFVQRRARGPQLVMKSVLRGIQRQYGTHLHTALEYFDGDMTAVWDHIVGDKHNMALLKAGVLLKEPD